MRVVLPAVLPVLLLSGCLGTLHSRFPQPRAGAGMFGWPVFAGVCHDCLLVSGHSHAYPHDSGEIGSVPLFAVWAFLSVPLDLGLDLVLLPIDAVVGAFGWERTATSPKREPTGAAPR